MQGSSSQGASWGAPGVHPCAECGEGFYHKRMMLSWRPDHERPADEPDLPKKRLKFCVECELRLRLTDERLRAELDELERMQKTFRGRKDQPAMLRALDYDDRGGLTTNGQEGMNVFYVCKRKVDACTTCGLYMAGKFWKKSGRKWKCGIDGDEWEKHTGASRALVENLGCGAAYRPWACGEGMVLEFKMKGQWWAVLADLMPEILDDEIKKVQASWHRPSVSRSGSRS